MEEAYLVTLDRLVNMVTPDDRFINANKFTNIDVITPVGYVSNGYGLVLNKHGVRYS